jgi:hypothetical protein
VRFGPTTRTCPACDVAWDDTDARWCGACGEALRAVTPSAHDTDRAGPRRRRAAVLLGAVTLAGVVTVAVGTVERRLPTTAEVTDEGVVAPDRAEVTDPERSDDREVPAVTEPTCVDGQDCFAWTVELSGDRASIPSSIALDELVVVADGGTLTAREARSGAVRWRETIDDTSSASGVPVTGAGGLLLHTDGADVVRRDLRDGRELWRTDELGVGGLGPSVTSTGDTTLVVGTPRPTDDGDQGGRTTVAGVDAATGEVRWQTEGQVAGLHPEGVVLTADEGTLVGIGPAGATVWERDLDGDTSGGAVVQGDVVQTYGQEGPGALLDAATGRELEVDGTIVGADGPRVLVLDAGDDGTGRVHLVEDGAVRWTTGLDDAPCLGSLSGRRVTIDVCGGGQVELDPNDGRLLRTVDAGPQDRRAGWGQRFGEFRLRSVDGGGTGAATGLELLDAAGGVIARFPDRTWPVVARNGDGQADAQVGGVLVLEHEERVVAVRSP